MMGIYLCEDSIPQLNAWEILLHKHIFINDLNAKILCKTAFPEKLLSLIADTRPYLGLYYLDINLNQELDGFSLALKIREIDPRAHIVFISVHKELCLEPYHRKIEVLDFIWKNAPNKNQQMTQCLDVALRNYYRFTRSHVRNELILKYHGDNIYLNSADIMYLEALSESHKINIYLKQECIQHRGSLNDLFSQLDFNTFYRCHHAYIVNYAYIDRLLTNEHMVLLKTGEKIPYSSRKQTGLQEWLKRNKNSKTYTISGGP